MCLNLQASSAVKICNTEFILPRPPDANLTEAKNPLLLLSFLAALMTASLAYWPGRYTYKTCSLLYNALESATVPKEAHRTSTTSVRSTSPAHTHHQSMVTSTTPL